MRCTRVLPVCCASAANSASRPARSPGSLHFHQLVIMQGAHGLAHQGRCQPGSAETDQGAQGMRQGPQLLALALGELGGRHGGVGVH
jgi:hypothetical protein